MTSEEIERAWFDIETLVRCDWNISCDMKDMIALRHEMEVQTKMIEIASMLIGRLRADHPMMPTEDDLKKTIRERLYEKAEAELKGR
ncbi:MAG: hypothetical protein NUV49_02495 [Patescibacteria group bacterium]|nr:hypothetical protein [Patescibacteria group bacterium]